MRKRPDVHPHPHGDSRFADYRAGRRGRLAHTGRNGRDGALRSGPGRGAGHSEKHPLWIYDGQGRIVDGRKTTDGSEGGAAYRFLKERFFPQLRNSRIGVVCTVDSLPQEKLPPVVPAVSPAVAFARKPVPASGPPRQCAGRPGPEAEEREPLQRLALKTNLLYDAILMPSLEVEYRIDDRWSVNLEGEVAWWSENSKHKYYQIATISPEARYWFGTKKPWHGHA